MEISIFILTVIGAVCAVATIPPSRHRSLLASACIACIGVAVFLYASDTQNRGSEPSGEPTQVIGTASPQTTPSPATTSTKPPVVATTTTHRVVVTTTSKQPPQQ